MALPSEAKSEWVTAEGDRYAATPEQVLKRDQWDAFTRHTVQDRVDVGGCTQVILRKSRLGAWTLLLNGRTSPTADVDARGWHTLPKFDTKDNITEDATGRKIPAPVLVTVLLEQGACAPESVTLQVLERVFVANLPINEGREMVVTEVSLEPTRPGDVNSQCTVVPYPMALGPSARVEIVDRSKQRATRDTKNADAVKGFMDAAIQKLSGKALSRQRVQSLLNKLPTWVSLAGTAAAAYYFLQAAEQSFANSAGTEAAGLVQGYTTNAIFFNLISSMYTTMSSSASTTAPTNPTDSSTDDKVVSISVFDLPAILKRISNSVSGGIYSKQGMSWTPEELRKARRYDDAALLEYLMYAQSLDATEQEKNLANWRTRLESDNFENPGTWTRDGIEENVKEFKTIMEKASEELQGYNRNQFRVTGVASDVVKRDGYIETALRLQVVDAHIEGVANLQTFTLASNVAFEAGLVASGYVNLGKELEDSIEELVSRIKGRDPQLSNSPLVQQVLTNPLMVPAGAPTGKLLVDLADFLVGRKSAVYAPSLDALTITLANLRTQVTEQLNTMLDPVSGLSTNAVVVPLMRRLPHVVALRNRSIVTFAVERDDEAIDIAASNTPSANNSDGLRDAVQVANATMRVVRYAITQFIEGEGVVRPRTRLQLVVEPTALVGTWGSLDATELGAARPLPERTAPLGIHTRHVYAPRLPMDVLGALACRAQHQRIEEAVVVQWLVSDGGAADGSPSVATRFGVPSSHTGELLLSVIADLATDEALDRVRSEMSALSPTRAHLMASAVEVAVQRLRLAGDLARAVFRQRPVRVRVSDHDALFDCYPEGPTLRKLLHEHAMWRGWEAPWFVARDISPPSRFEALAAAASAVPMGIGALEQLLDALRGIKAAEWRLSRMPFLAPQTLAFHSDEALRALHTRSPGSALLMHNAWAGLAVQVEHSYFAAQRLHVLGQGLPLSNAHRAATLCECAFARPILELVPTGDRLMAVPETERVGLRMLTRPFAQLLRPLQEGMPTLPHPRSLLSREAAARWLPARFASMRMDLGALQSERVLAGSAGDLMESFERMHIGPTQHLVPFGAALIEDAVDTASRCFEDTPVYIHALAVPLPAVDGVQPTAVIRPRPAHDTDTDAHPLAITIDAQQGGVAVGMAVAHVPLRRLKDDAATEPPATLREARDQARAADKTTPLGGSIDTTAAFVFAVERLVQSAIAVAGEHGSVDVDPPPIFMPQKMYVVSKSVDTDVLRLAKRRVSSLLLLVGEGDVTLLVGVLKKGSPVSIDRNAALVTELEARQMALTDGAIASDAAVRELSENLVVHVVTQTDGEADDALDRAFDDAVSPLVEGVVDLNAYLREKQAEAQRANEQLVTAQGADGSAAVGIGGGYALIESAAVAAMRQNSTLLAATAAFDKASETNAAARKLAEDTNRSIGELSVEARRIELILWPIAVATANALVAGILEAPPRLGASARWGERDVLVEEEASTLLARGSNVLSTAIGAWKGAGLVAVPLCELAAVVVGVSVA